MRHLSIACPRVKSSSTSMGTGTFQGMPCIDIINPPSSIPFLSPIPRSNETGRRPLRHFFVSSSGWCIQTSICSLSSRENQFGHQCQYVRTVLSEDHCRPNFHHPSAISATSQPSRSPTLFSDRTFIALPPSDGYILGREAGWKSRLRVRPPFVPRQV